MSIKELSDIPKILVELFSRWGIDIKIENAQRFVDCVLFFIVFLLLFKYGKKIFNWVKSIFHYGDKKYADNYIYKALFYDFPDYLATKGGRNKIFIETQFTDMPPNNTIDLSDSPTSSTRESMSTFWFGRILNEYNANKRLYMVFGGTGMGKTTFMVNLLCQYVRRNVKNKSLPYEIVLLRLSDENIMTEIKDINNKTKTILLLDALDESRAATEDFECFKTELEDVIRDFRFVIISCRTQFFENDDSFPRQTNWLLSSTKNFIEYNRIFISPFTVEEAYRYIDIKYKDPQKREKAKAIFEQCKDLMSRPLLISYIGDLIKEDRNFYCSVDIYAVLIEKWIEREVAYLKDKSNEQKESLYIFSSEIALKIYDNWKNESRMFINAEEFDELKSINKIQQEHPYQYKARSLLNRNTNGEWKFAHKSFMEFFLAKKYFEDETFEMSFDGMSAAKEFYGQMCNRWLLTKNEKNGSIIYKFNNSKYKPYVYYEIDFQDVEMTNFRNLRKFMENKRELALKVYVSCEQYNDAILAFCKDNGVENVSVSQYRPEYYNVISGVLSLKCVKELNVCGSDDEDLPEYIIELAKDKNVYLKYNEITYCYPFDEEVTAPTYYIYRESIDDMMSGKCFTNF